MATMELWLGDCGNGKKYLSKFQFSEVRCGLCVALHCLCSAGCWPHLGTGPKCKKTAKVLKSRVAVNAALAGLGHSGALWLAGGPRSASRGVTESQRLRPLNDVRCLFCQDCTSLEEKAKLKSEQEQ